MRSKTPFTRNPKTLYPILTAVLIALTFGGAAQGADQEFYELRAYRVSDAAMQATLIDYLESGLVPALNRAGLDRIRGRGVALAPNTHGTTVRSQLYCCNAVYRNRSNAFEWPGSVRGDFNRRGSGIRERYFRC